MPVVIPQRVSPELLRTLGDSPLKQVLVIHCNHPQELDRQVKEALGALAGVGVVLLNQSVLLRGVNDSPGTIVSLCEELFDAGVQPYYMHMLDRVDGAAHFEVPEWRAMEIRQGVEKALPGYLVPRFVRELPGADSKAALPGTPGRSDTNLL
jgi:KamA family protein